MPNHRTNPVLIGSLKVVRSTIARLTGGAVADHRAVCDGDGRPARRRGRRTRLSTSREIRNASSQAREIVSSELKPTKRATTRSGTARPKNAAPSAKKAKRGRSRSAGEPVGVVTARYASVPLEPSPMATGAGRAGSTGSAPPSTPRSRHFVIGFARKPVADPRSTGRLAAGARARRCRDPRRSYLRCRSTPTRMSGQRSTASTAERIGMSVLMLARYA